MADCGNCGNVIEFNGFGWFEIIYVGILGEEMERNTEFSESQVFSSQSGCEMLMRKYSYHSQL